VPIPGTDESVFTLAVADEVVVRRPAAPAASWPFSDLRDLVLTQPFLATPGGNPSVLYLALASAPELRPYLFYGAGGSLAPVWADN